jgi:hypothetical protein
LAGKEAVSSHKAELTGLPANVLVSSQASEVQADLTVEWAIEKTAGESNGTPAGKEKGHCATGSEAVAVETVLATQPAVFVGSDIHSDNDNDATMSSDEMPDGLPSDEVYRSPGPIPTFLFQRPTFPFGFPNASTSHAFTGDICITYPPELTKRLSVPLTKAQCKMEGIPHVPEPKENIRRRKQACNEVQGQCW